MSVAYRLTRFKKPKLIAQGVLFVSICALSPDCVFAQENTRYDFEKTINNQKIAVVLETGPFDADKHTVRHLSDEEGYLVDEQKPIGTDGATHAVTEFKRFDVYWNGKKIPLEDGSWSSIFNVPLRQIDPSEQARIGLAIIPAADGSSILFYFVTGLVDVRLEQAWLVVDKNAKWRRFRGDEIDN
jgi:hypothetical protein